ncbi:carboxymuconolactone decarboxylase family protein [Roseateles oligotrophus]|uniref:Carboxymuconolactone decarboxylase family protein n=1 Tax=Roseateles oligotrophus TaxID=1769250 RepID=A0ABT2YH43_9BURK|nr:carboxymuconolactone decarboxylase family protein [Roseateles oligotrophus]MCV2369354.1 carboxymuconolactone decarboxylase family protein [Roseateles oligotrophus]
MSKFPIHTMESAPEGSQSLLRGATQAYGFMPNLLAGMANAPALLEGYMTLAGIFNKTALTETERQIILMTANRIHGCTCCMAAHSFISSSSGVSAEVVASLRNNSPIADAKLEALRQFAIVMVNSRGWPEPKDVQALVAAGYGQQTVLEVILGISLKVMSNYTNHIVQTPVDGVFASHIWVDGQAGK